MKEDDIKEALLKKALGFVSDEIVEEYTTDENGLPVLAKRKITKKFNPPDINAVKYILEQSEFSDDELSKMSDEQLLKEKERLLRLLVLKEKEENEDGDL